MAFCDLVHYVETTGCPKKTITLLINRIYFYITASNGMYLNKTEKKISILQESANSHVASSVAMETNTLIFYEI